MCCCGFRVRGKERGRGRGSGWFVVRWEFIMGGMSEVAFGVCDAGVGFWCVIFFVPFPGVWDLICMMLNCMR